MSDIALDPVTRDLLLVGGRARLATGAEAVRQSWESHLTMFLGECFLDRSLGIDYQNEVLIKGARPAVLRAIFAKATRETPGIADVESLDFTLNHATRVLKVTAVARLDSGDKLGLQTTQQLGG